MCLQRAWLVCGVEEGEIEFENHGEERWAWVSRTAYPYEFDCAVCGLNLEETELEHLSMNAPIKIEPREAGASDYTELFQAGPL